MRTFLLFAALAFSPIALVAQVKKESPKPKKTVEVVAGDADVEKVFTKIELEAGTNQKQWQQYLSKAAVLPDSIAKQLPPGSYMVEVQFIIDKHGYISQVQSKNDPGWGLGKMAVLIIRNYPGAWTPASQCGRQVNSYKKQQIVFVVAE